MDSTIANVTAIELPEVSAEHVEVSLVLWIASAALGVAFLIATCCSCCVNGIKKWRLSQNSGCEGDKVSLTFRSIDLWFGSGNDRAQALKSVSGHVRSGELLAIMGPSGSGKVESESLMNDRKCGYVPQHALLPFDISVSEIMESAAAFQLGASMSRALRKDRVRSLMKTLELDHVKGNIIREDGSGVSGGQAQRLMMACHGMMSVSTKLMFADEPTTGLSSTDSHHLIRVLRKLADEQGYAIVVTIHQPSAAIFSMFDRVLVMEKGETVYMGKTSFEQIDGYLQRAAKYSKRYLNKEVGRSMKIEPNENVANSLLDLVTDSECAEAMKGMWKGVFQSVIECKLNDAEHEGASNDTSVSSKSSWGFLGFLAFVTWSFLIETIVWTKLCLLVLWQQPRYLLIPILVSCVSESFSALLYFQLDVSDISDLRTVIGFFGPFLMANNPAWTIGIIWWFALLPSVDLSLERAHFSTGSFVVAQIISNVTRVVCIAVVAGTAGFCIAGIQWSAEAYFVLIAMKCLTSIVALMFALCLSACGKDDSIAFLLLSAFVVIQATYSGLFVSPAQLEPYISWIYELNPLGYAIEALLYSNLRDEQLTCDGNDCVVPADVVLDDLGFRNRLSFDFAALVLYSIVPMLLLQIIFLLKWWWRRTVGFGQFRPIEDPDRPEDNLELSLSRSVFDQGAANDICDLDDVLSPRFLQDREDTIAAMAPLRSSDDASMSPKRLGKMGSRKSIMRSISGLASRPSSSSGVAADVRAAPDVPETDLDTPVGAWSDWTPPDGASSVMKGDEEAPVEKRSIKVVLKGVTVSSTRLKVQRRCPVIRRDRLYRCSNVNAVFNAGMVHAIMGPSGRLLEALSGVGNTVVEGLIEVNGVPVKRGLLSSGHAKLLTQHEVMEGCFTVDEHFTMAAELQMRGTYGEKARVIEALLKLLKLDHRRSNRVTELSGGEKRRTAFAVDVLLSEARVLLLDEPTSGLSAADSAELMSIVLFLAEEWSYTIIMTIHQPRERIFGSFHTVTLMKKGQVVAQASPKSLLAYLNVKKLCKEGSGTAEVLLDQVNEDETVVAMKEFFEGRPVVEVRDTDQGNEKEKAFQPMFLNQFITLFWARCIALLRDWPFAVVQLFQLLFVGLLVAFTSIRPDFNTETVNQFFGAASQWQAVVLYAFNGFLLSNVTYFDVRHHDRVLRKYSLVTSELAETIVTWMFLYLITQIPNFVLYMLIGLRDDAVYFFAFTWALVWVVAAYYSLTKAIYSATHNLPLSLSIMCLTQEVTLAVSGFYIFPSDMPSWLSWIRFGSPGYYAYEIIVLSIADNRRIECGGEEFRVDDCPLDGSDFVDDAGFHSGAILRDFLILAAMNVVFKVLCIAAERYYESGDTPKYSGKESKGMVELDTLSSGSADDGDVVVV